MDYRVTLSVLLLAASHAGAQITFQGIGQPSEFTQTFAEDVSDDGTTIVGWTVGPTFSQGTAFKWTRSSGHATLSPLSGFPNARAMGVSADGAVIVGFSTNETFSESVATRWNAPQSPTEIASGSNAFAVTTGVSSDGSVASGTRGYRAFRWTSGGGAQDLPLPTDFSASRSNGISRDGRFVVGVGGNGANIGAGLVWDAAGEISTLVSPQTSTLDIPYAVSDDGGVVVGYSRIGTGESAVRWGPDRKPMILGALANPEYVNARDVSGDGSIAVGWCQQIGSGMQAVIWDADGHIHRVADLLAAAGINMDPWYLSEVTAISGDGRTIVGNGAFIGTGGEWVDQSWIATIPAPGFPAACLIGSVLAIGKRRRDRLP